MLSHTGYSRLACLLAGTAFATLAGTASAADLSTAATVNEQGANEPSYEVGEIVVVGKGQTRSVSTLLPANLETLPPGTSVQKALNFLPGV